RTDDDDVGFECRVLGDVLHCPSLLRALAQYDLGAHRFHAPTVTVLDHLAEEVAPRLDGRRPLQLLRRDLERFAEPGDAGGRGPPNHSARARVLAWVIPGSRCEDRRSPVCGSATRTRTPGTAHPTLRESRLPSRLAARFVSVRTDTTCVSVIP